MKKEKKSQAVKNYNHYEKVATFGRKFAFWDKMLAKYERSPIDKMSFITIPLEKKIDTPDQYLLGKEIFKALVDEASVVGIIHKCMCRTSGKCTSHSDKIGCIVLGDAVKELDPVIGKIVTKEEAYEHIENGFNDGLFPLLSHYHRDAFMFGLDIEKLLTICFCCTCHCNIRNFSKMSEGLDNSFFSNTYKIATVEVSLDSEKCVACGRCESVCIANAITKNGDKYVLDSEKCKGCGHCLHICNAFSVEYDKSIVKDILKHITAHTKIN